MASVTSLGLHTPTALSYLIQERLLPPEPPADSYKWQTIHRDDEVEPGDDELITTETSVVWCRGGIVRKSFRFEVEKEPVTRAVLTSFPIDKHKRKTFSQNGPSKTTHQWKTDRQLAMEQSKAIVVFLKTQAHVYFLSGTSHVIHLPFEVESAIAAPNGLIIQRKIQVERLATASLKFPRVPPNSFIASQTQTQTWSATSSQQSNFSIASLGSPKQLPLPSTTLFGDAWQMPPLKDDSSWPRLFSLTDPLAEMGLVVTTSKAGSNRRVPLKALALDPAEEIIHTTGQDEFAIITGDDQEPLILAVTLNRETSMYTVWRMSYVDPDEVEKHKVPSTTGAVSRRRSSFAHGIATGSATPIPFRESLGPGSLGLSKVVSRKEDSIDDEKLDFVSALDPDFETTGVPRRKSRRVSSMLARSDLSASHERSAFSDLASGYHHSGNRRGDSLGSQHTRNSIGFQISLNGHNHSQTQPPHLANSIGSLLEAPVDNLLEELRAGGDFEGFNNMGLEDDTFDGLRKDVIFTKIESVPVEQTNVRYSTQRKPAQSQCKTFTLTAPPCSTEDRRKNQIVICILDAAEKRLLVLTFNVKTHITSQSSTYTRNGEASGANRGVVVVTFEKIIQAKGVLDACKVSDGDISRILILTQSANGFGDLTLQAPWSSFVKVSLPQNITVNNTRSVGHDASLNKKREVGFNRVLSHRPQALLSLRNPLPHGLVDVTDDGGYSHQLCIQMQPRVPLVKQVLDICRHVLPGPKGGETFLVGWWNARQWLGNISTDESENEWTSLVILLFAAVMGAHGSRSSPVEKKRRSRGFLRSSSGAKADTSNWQAMLAQETAIGGPRSQWMMSSGWAWLDDAGSGDLQMNRGEYNRSQRQATPQIFDDEEKFLPRHIRLARDFASSDLGQAAVGPTGDLPTTGNRGMKSAEKVLTSIVIGLHLLREDQKLDVTTVDSLDTANPSLTPILAQICSWLGWDTWTSMYQVEDISMGTINIDPSIMVKVHPPFDPPSVLDWIQSSLMELSLMPFVTISDIIGGSDSFAHDTDQWSILTPRTAFFWRFFSAIQPASESVEIVEALYASGGTTDMLDSLPEAILIPLREAIVNCQAQPPVTWGTDLLSLVDREDVNMLLFPELQRKISPSLVLTPTHESSIDVHAICVSNSEPETIGAFDGSADIDRQSLTRLVFKNDRRFNEAAKILNTNKPTIARVEAEASWSESELLEAQKEHAQMLAIRTLAIPTGRGLLYFSARIPLLTEKFPMGGFNLHCIMKPTNNTVGVDKNAFTEEKVCWAFFHSGVASGLSISRAAKGIDTSWILYNKPEELSNRHAGFLLALGLNGHLKSVAKWVAFKYLTPKHTMTSIGLLLGLAVSYLGTMDSLITRLLSVHVTRMLPPGAAELNLSPLTQTTGIMGIGLLYCNTQHRRMSEIMMSEIEHTNSDTEDEPLRNEGYRLAAGFALGFINLGKGSDLKGLHDMRLTERLLTIAVGSKKISLVHILDKATAASIVAIALIFMKSEDSALARKIDVPSSTLQYDYVRPDMFLLRTVARHLIMWNKIEASLSWIERNLPGDYRERSRLDNENRLTSKDLPFYDIITGLCFSIALKNAGSGSLQVRDLLIHYLDQMMRICLLPAENYDQQLARSTTRNCQDLLALSVATVMAGTGDLVVFRRLRALHGRDDKEVPYGSHLAAHLAIGALFLGGGTYTFGTSDLAVASLIVAFYPLFPTSILDNKSHLQAFRHFWVLATEARCLVARDIDTNRPVSVPLSISLYGGRESQGHTPCLLPDLEQICSVSTTTREYWNVVLDFKKNPKHLEAFKSTQTIYLRRRPAYDASTAVFHTTLQALDDRDGTFRQPLEWLFDLPVFSMLTTAERALVLPPDNVGSIVVHASTEGTLVDTRLVLEKATLGSGKRDRLLGLKMLFEWANKMQAEGKEMQWIRSEVLDRLKAAVWMMDS